MDGNPTVYSGNKKEALLRGLFFFALLFGLTLTQYNEDGFADKKRLMALGLFWLVGIIFSVIPLGFKLRAGNDYVETYFLSHHIATVFVSEVQTVNREFDIFSGKGIRVRTLRNEQAKTHFLGEDLFGKKAIIHASQVLIPKKSEVAVHPASSTSALKQSTPRHRIIGSIGAIAAIALFFFALTHNDVFSRNAVVGLLVYPGSWLVAFFGIGYAIDGKLKTATRFGLYFILLILAVVALGLIKHYTK